MALHAHRSQRVEELAASLASTLTGGWPEDPLESLPILVGSRGMERWLRHDLATRLGGLAGVDFLFPRAAFDAVTRWLLTRPTPGGPGPRFRVSVRSDDAWAGGALTLGFLESLRARRESPAFARVHKFLGPVSPEVGGREIRFATAATATLERLLYDRPDDARAWTQQPEQAPPEHRWLAHVLADLAERRTEPSPAARLAALRALPPRATGRALYLFGLSTLRAGDKERLAALAPHLEVHIFALAPSSEWWQDIRRADQPRIAVKRGGDSRQLGLLFRATERQNALLRSNGTPSRDLQQWLEDVGYDEPEPPLQPATQPPPSLLTEVQRWVDRAADNPQLTPNSPAPWAAHAQSSSLEVHACHGALRQCEALRDELLRRFARDPSLEPRHVLVMATDVATYAPLLSAVFARHGNGVPAIPLHVADLGIRSHNQVAEALLQIVAGAAERISASRLLGLLVLRPVLARFGLTDEDVADLRTMVVRSGMRWGWDAADRARHEQPPVDQNTIRFGLERLALGVLMPDPGDLGVVPAALDGTLGPAVPVDVISRERVARFGQLAELAAALESAREELSTPGTNAEWRRRLGAVLDAFTETRESDAWLRVQVDETLASLFADAAGGDLLFDPTAVNALLRGAFDVPQQGDRPITGAVTVCALEPMRSVPFRVIAMVGLDDGSFPPVSRTAAWDPFSHPRRGEYDRRTVARHLFLEALLCARDAFLLFGNGFEAKRGVAVPLSVVVTELLEVVAAGVGRTPEAFVRRHPLQPWSESAFADEGRLPFDRTWVSAARALRQPSVRAGLRATALAATFPPDPRTDAALTAEALAAALLNPHQELLKGRLGLALGGKDVEVPDREALEGDPLSSFHVRELALHALDTGTSLDVDALEVRLRGEGELPLKALGRRLLETCIEEARAARRHAETVPGTKLGPQSYAYEVAGMRLSAIAPDVRSDDLGQRFVWATGSKAPSAKLLLVAHVTMSIAVAAGEWVHSAHLAGYDKAVAMHPPIDTASARAHLAALVRIYQASRSGIVLLFPHLSREVERVARKFPTATAEEIVRRAGTGWLGRDGHGGDVEDPWVAGLFGDLSLEDLARHAAAIREYAAIVWAPVVDGLEAGAR